MIYPIRLYGDPMLRKKASPVTSFDAALKQLAADMLETMYHYNGIGLAGPQIGVPKRLFIAVEVDKSQEREEDEDAPPPLTMDEKRERWGVIAEHFMVNPEILSRSGEQPGVDGCLSLPGLFTEDVQREDEITVRYQDAAGEWHERNAKGHFAWVIQHEYDHLEGVFFFDRLPAPAKRAFIDEHRSELAAMQREAKAFLKEHRGSEVTVQ